jgi:glycosyltransferase involved in cell wall biosynthesis
MRIGFIARGLTKGGVTRYIENVLRAFDDSFLLEDSLFLFTDREDFKTIYKNIKVIYINNSNKIYWDCIKVMPFLFKTKLDVVFYPKNIIPFTHLLFRFKKINIVHDLAYFDKSLNEYKLFDTLYMKAFMKLSCTFSDRIIAVSLATKKDIENVFKISSAKISVVHEGVEDKFKPQENKSFIQQTLLKYKIKEPFIFYCGSLSPRKNILRTLMAFNDIKDKVAHNIYLAGGQSWHDEEVRRYIKDQLSDRVFIIGHISDEELINMYSSADLYLYPSLYEGFGLPILEAQACGCAVLTSDKTSCPEVAGEGSAIVDPLSKSEISNKMLEILENKNYKNLLIENGFKNVKKFNWTDSVKGLIQNI